MFLNDFSFDLYAILDKYNLITLVKAENTFLKVVKLNKISKKIDKNLVDINYSHYSPYKNGDFTYFVDKKILYIWFYSKTKDTPFIMIEPYILAKYFIKKKNFTNGILYFDSKYKLLLIIKESYLNKQITKKHFNDFELNLLKKEFQVNLLKKYSEHQYKDFIKKGFKLLSIKDYYNSLNININFKELSQLLIKKIYIPVLILIGSLVSIELLNNYFLKTKIKDIEIKYKDIRKKTQLIREDKKDLLKTNITYKFVKDELNYNKIYFIILEKISNILEKYKANLVFLKLNDDEFSIRFDTNKTNEIFSELVKIKEFSELKIQNSIKNRYNKSEHVFVKGQISVK